VTREEQNSPPMGRGWEVIGGHGRKADPHRLKKRGRMLVLRKPPMENSMQLLEKKNTLLECKDEMVTKPVTRTKKKKSFQSEVDRMSRDKNPFEGGVKWGRALGRKVKGKKKKKKTKKNENKHGHEPKNWERGQLGDKDFYEV